MAQAKRCPICKWPVKGSKKCPCCGWVLESEELILSEPSVLQEFEDKMAQARKQWRKAIADYSSGRLGYGEEAVRRLRKRLKEKGFNPGKAFSNWALAHAPEPSGSYAFPASQTKEDAEGLSFSEKLCLLLTFCPLRSSIRRRRIKHGIPHWD